MKFQKLWTLENIQKGIERYYRETGFYPTALEIDDCPYLPSSRQIQRRYGGLDQLRKTLGYAITHYGKGEYRSRESRIINQRSIESSIWITQYLIDVFGEYFVHIEKPLDKYIIRTDGFNKRKIRSDYFVYARGINFGIDIFYPKNFSSWTGALNIKLRNYKYVNIPLYIVNVNEATNITEERVKLYLMLKKTPMPDHITLLNKTRFIQELQRYIPLHLPV